jgi:hypothetical protein
MISGLVESVIGQLSMGRMRKGMKEQGKRTRVFLSEDLGEVDAGSDGLFPHSGFEGELDISSGHGWELKRGR